jgi:hypothetical protein
MVGFGAKRQNVHDNLSMQHFRSHFGIGPGIIVAIIAYEKNEHLLMTLCWLKLYKTEHVMSGRWGYGEKVCRDTVKHIASRLQHLKSKKIRFGRLIQREHIWALSTVFIVK